MILFTFPEDATPINDYSGLKLAWVKNISDLNRAEAENILQAQERYLHKKVTIPNRWFNVGFLKRVHQAMFGDVWRWAGEFRRSITSIGVEPVLIHRQLGELCIEVNSWSKVPVELTFVEQAARIHHRLALIHPFENGNGRFSRLIADRYLVAYGCAYPSWPHNLHDNGDLRISYIQSLRAADRGDYTLLLKLLYFYGAKNPSVRDLSKKPFYKRHLSEEQRAAILDALARSIQTWID